ncbi:MAG TPA: DUF4276 family protein [Fibrobacteria bacterium]|nr:DUF4276 family protein [Fibrobacteria bacterium]HOX52799.1 DUF4276 family protein [Fibrobacteria bacterium]
MSLVVVVCEGPTEKKFLNKVVLPGVPNQVFTSIVLDGNVRLPLVLNALEHASKSREYRRAYFTTFIDLSGLEGKEWGDRRAGTAVEKERLILETLKQRMVDSTFFERFRPHVQPHEFEALLFSDPSRMAKGLGRPDLAKEFQAILDEAGTPEAINTTPERYPAHRITALMGGYRKVLRGIAVAEEVGLEAMEENCPHFAGWMDWLRNLP